MASFNNFSDWQKTRQSKDITVNNYWQETFYFIYTKLCCLISDDVVTRAKIKRIEVVASSKDKVTDQIVPVFQIHHPNGPVITLCKAFTDEEWTISVQSTQAVTADFKNLLGRYGKGNIVNGVPKGFPADTIFKAYTFTNRKNFTVNLIGDYNVYAFIWLLGQNLGLNQQEIV